MFRLELVQAIVVYQYDLRLIPDEIFDPFVVNDIFEKKNRHYYRMLGSYVPSGRLMFTLSPIAETITDETVYKG